MKRRPALVLLAVLTACGPEDDTNAPGTTRSPNEESPASAPTPAPLGDLAWLPAAAPSALVFTRGPELQGALDELARFADATPGLPVRVALQFRGAAMQASLLERTLAEGGFVPEQTLAFETEAGAPCWAWVSPEDLGALKDRTAKNWGLSWRDTVGAAVGSPALDSSFPFEVVVLEGDLVVLTPKGRGSEILKWLAAADPGDASEILAGVPMAPVRGYFRGPALLSPQTEGAPSAFENPDAPWHTFFARPGEVALDASVRGRDD